MDPAPRRGLLVSESLAQSDRHTEWLRATDSAMLVMGKQAQAY